MKPPEPKIVELWQVAIASDIPSDWIYIANQLQLSIAYILQHHWRAELLLEDVKKLALREMILEDLRFLYAVAKIRVNLA